MGERQTYRKLVEQFAEAAEKSYAATVTGDWEANNTWVKRQVDAFRQITEMGNPARDELLRLLKHKNPAVAMSAAVFSLGYATRRSLKVLRRISTQPGLLGFEAQQALVRWQEGSWRLEEPATEERSTTTEVTIEHLASQMNSEIAGILQAIPDRVDWNEVAQREHLDGRVAVADWLYGDVIDMGEGYVGWIPNPYTPSGAKLIWWWIVRPDLGAAIAYEAPEEIRHRIAAYIAEYSRSTSDTRASFAE